MNNQSYYYTREKTSPNQPPQLQSRTTPPPPPPPKKKKFDINKYKKNAINSLNEVECFLHNLKKITNSIKLYKILK